MKRYNLFLAFITLVLVSLIASEVFSYRLIDQSVGFIEDIDYAMLERPFNFYMAIAEEADHALIFEEAFRKALEAPVEWQWEGSNPAFLAKLTLPSDDFEWLHLKSVYGGSYMIFSEHFESLRTVEIPRKNLSVADLLSESFTMLDASNRIAYVVVEYNPYLMNDGLGRFSRVIKSPQLGDYLSRITENRYALGVMLLILTCIQLLVSVILKHEVLYAKFKAMAYFTGLFSLWVLTDFPRYSYWIINHYRFLPFEFLYMVFILSSTLMVPSFVYLTGLMLEKKSHKKMIKVLFFFTLLVSVIIIGLETTRLFTWNLTLNRAYFFMFDLQYWTVTLGIIFLMAISILDIPSQQKYGILYILGMLLCLITFFISQVSIFLISHWGVLILLVCISIIIAKGFMDLESQKKKYLHQLSTKNEEMILLNKDLELTQQELLLRLGSTVDLRSKETSNHVQRVSVITELLAQALGFSDDKAKLIGLASTLHDIGKVGIPDRILDHPGKLTKEDYEAMKQHANMGFEILNGSYNELMDVAAIIALTHHEKYDGTGYPNGLTGEDIPIYGAIVAVADVFDALFSKRVYKEAWPKEEVISFFMEERGKHFSPKVVDQLIANQEAIYEAIKGMGDA